MFRKKKRKASPRFIHPELGELVYESIWWMSSWWTVSAFPLVLWDKTYNVRIHLYQRKPRSHIEIREDEESKAPKEPEKPSQAQEEAFREFVRITVEQKDTIERIIFKCSDCCDNAEQIYDRVVPSDVYINSKGECILFLDIKEPLNEEGNCVMDFEDALVLIPGWLYVDADDAFDMMREDTVSEMVQEGKKFYEEMLS